MQLHYHQQPTSSTLGAFPEVMQCPQCAEPMVAPLRSEFVMGGEIRHHWVCEACGETCCTTVSLNDA